MFRTGDLGDVLGAITLVGDFLRRSAPDKFKLWKNYVEVVMNEEGLGYTLDDKLGVHPKIDVEFERVRLASVSYLGSPRYRAVLHEFEAAYRALESDPPDTKLAVRTMFEAIEILFRLLLGSKAKALGSSEVNKILSPLVRSVYAEDPLAANTMAKLVNGLAEWANGLQAYRHGQAVEEPSPPPIEAAVAAVQTGSAYLRLLVELDRKMQGGASEGA